MCDCPDDLWICLICGNVGCGRYKEGHAKKHWQTTAHSFSLELETQHIWDYAGDMWVHRLIREKGDGKVVELPSRGRPPGRNSAAQDEDVVPRAKLDNIGLEYTNLLNTQLETQRIYFEEKLSKLADKAAKSAAIAESAAAEAKEATRQSVLMQTEIRKLKEELVPGLEKDLARERLRANKSTELARNLGKSLQEEKEVSKGLMERVAHVNKELEGLKTRVDELKLEKAELEESNRDLTMFISGQEQLKKLEGEGRIEAGELEAGVVSLPEEKTKGKGKGRRKK
jgi:BRCA1-associated protein